MNPNVATDAGPSLCRAMYRLWMDHVIWPRDYVAPAIDGAADAVNANNASLSRRTRGGRWLR